MSMAPGSRFTLLTRSNIWCPTQVMRIWAHKLHQNNDLCSASRFRMKLQARDSDIVSHVRQIPSHTCLVRDRAAGMTRIIGMPQHRRILLTCSIRKGVLGMRRSKATQQHHEHFPATRHPSEHSLPLQFPPVCMPGTPRFTDDQPQRRIDSEDRWLYAWTR
jgi:hypothetical protein